MALAPDLYDRLRRRFGRVRIANEDEAPVIRYGLDPLSRKPRLQIDAAGQEFRVDCPRCGDTKQHLYLAHIYGQKDPVSGFDLNHLAHCFKCGWPSTHEQRQDLHDRVFGYVNACDRQTLLRVRPELRNNEESWTLEPVDAPGELQPISTLEPDWAPVRYLTDRGFDVGELANEWGVSYCVESEEYSWIVGRLIVPIVMDGEFVGWQARHVGEREWGRFPKYITMPGLPKRLVLYNYDLARRQPCVVITEGVTDVWKVGPAGVALLGKSASRQQIQLLARGWPGKPAIVLLDGDAEAEGAKLTTELRPYFPAGVVQVRLPEEADPGSMSCADIWAAIEEQARTDGVVLPREG